MAFCGGMKGLGGDLWVGGGGGGHISIICEHIQQMIFKFV